MRLPRTVRLCIAALVLIVLVGGIVLGIRALLRLGGGSASEGTIIQARPDDTVVAFGDGYLVMSADGTQLHCYRPNAKDNWSSPDAVPRQFSASNDLVALWAGQTLKVLDKTGAIAFNSQLSGDIDIARVGASNVAAYIPSTHSIEVLAKEQGARVDSIDDFTGDVLDFGFYSQQDLLWVLSLDTATLQPTTYIKTYQLGKTTMGGQAFEDQIVYDVLFCNNQLFAVGTKDVSAITPNSAAQSNTAQSLVYGWQKIDAQGMGGDSLAILFTLTGENVAGTPQRLKVIRSDGTAQEMNLPPGCVGALVGPKGVWGISANTIYAQSFTGVVKTYDLPIAVDALITKLGENRAVVRTGEDLRIITLPKH